MRRPPRPDAPAARAALFTPTRARPEDSRSRAIATPSGSVRARSQPTWTRASVPPRRSPGLPSPPHPAPASRRAGVSARGGLWRTRRCRGAGCGTVFSICGSCWRGQAYCGAPCRATAQRAQRRHATARHQRSPEGRLDHRDRQRAYRARRRFRVTDAPSTRPPRSTTIAAPVGRAAIRPVCLVCGRVWARRGARRGPPARQGGAQRRKAPDDGNS